MRPRHSRTSNTAVMAVTVALVVEVVVKRRKMRDDRCHFVTVTVTVLNGGCVCAHSHTTRR